MYVKNVKFYFIVFIKKGYYKKFIEYYFKDYVIRCYVGKKLIYFFIVCGFLVMYN